MIQDHLGLGHEARINDPSHQEDNWHWRLKPGMLTGELEKKILNGNLIRINECKNAGLTGCFSEGKKVRVYRNNNNNCNFIAIYQYSKEKKGMIPDKMFLN